MKRPLTLRLTRATLACTLGLCACAPLSAHQTSSQPQGQTQASLPVQSSLPFQADFSDAGVAWVSGGQAYVARAPSFTVTHAPLPTPAVAVSWASGAAWAALPDIGQVITLDGPVQMLRVGRPWKLSHTRIYTQSGAALDYNAQSVDGFMDTPQAVMTGPDGQDYALVGGHLYKNASSNLPPLLLDTDITLDTARRAAPYLYATPSGIERASLPTLQTQQGVYRLTGSALELSSGNQVLRRVPYNAAGMQAAIGQVGNLIVALRSDGQLRAFMPDLREVAP